jgi:hypothetical protein
MSGAGRDGLRSTVETPQLRKRPNGPENFV